MNQKKFIDQIVRYEQEDMPEKEVIELFAELIKTGTAWRLQGHYGRTARDFIEQGIISEKGEILYGRDH